MLILFVINLYSFSFSLNDLKFDEKVKQGSSKTKEYILSNNNNDTKIYTLSIEDSKKDANIKIQPKNLIIDPLVDKKFNIEIKGTQNKGNYDYFLVIKELNKSDSKKGVTINKVIKIKQKYTIE